MEIHPKEDTRAKKHAMEALECNRNFYGILRELGVIPLFVHTDKDFSEISASQVTFLPHMESEPQDMLLERGDGIAAAVL